MFTRGKDRRIKHEEVSEVCHDESRGVLVMCGIPDRGKTVGPDRMVRLSDRDVHAKRTIGTRVNVVVESAQLVGIWEQLVILDNGIGVSLRRVQHK